MAKWIKIVKLTRPVGRKTDIFDVRTLDDFVIGKIYWYAKWRKYCFEPCFNTIYETQCLQDITDFIKKLMEDHKNGRKIPNPVD